MLRDTVEMYFAACQPTWMRFFCEIRYGGLRVPRLALNRSGTGTMREGIEGVSKLT
jgi:hypothetical protein